MTRPRTNLTGAVATAATVFGDVTRTWRVERAEVPPREAASASSDFVAVVDRSGSMWGEIASVKTYLGKLLGVHEAVGTADVTMSLVSYSSDGDCDTHFKHIPMSTAATDGHVAAEVDSLRATGMTGMSQALRAAAALARPGRVLYVTLMSDGYCNDPGVRSEQDGSERVVREVAAAGGVVSTVCYGDYADFAFLTRLASVGGGVCHRASTAVSFYRAMEAGVRDAAALRTSAVTVEAAGAEFVVIWDEVEGMVASSVENGDLVLRGDVPASAVAWRFTRLTCGAPVVGDDARRDSLASLLLARAALSTSDVPLAKELVVGSGHAAARRHWRALTSAEQRDLAAAVDDALAAGEAGVSLDAELAVLKPGPSVSDVLALVERFDRGTFKAHVPSIRATYSRRTVGRVPGTRRPDGSVEPFRFKLEATESEWADVTGVVLSRTRPNASVRVELPARLVDCRPEVSAGDVLRVTSDRELLKRWRFASADGLCLPRDAFGDEVTVALVGVDVAQVNCRDGQLGWMPITCLERQVTKVANVDLAGELRVVRSYTVVGDGSVTTPQMRLKVTDRRARAALRELGVAVDESTWEADVRFGDMAVASRDPGNCLPTLDETRRMLRAAALSRLLASTRLRGESPSLDAASVAALRDVGLTASLNFSPLTVAPYADVRQALSDGVVDTAVAYEVYVGTPDLPLLLKDLYGGDEFIQRRFSAARRTPAGLVDVDESELTGALLLEGTAVEFRAKSLSSRVKLNAADDAAWLVSCAVLGVAEPGAVEALEDALAFAYGALSDKALEAFETVAAARLAGNPNKASIAGELDIVRRMLDAAVQRFWTERVSPVVMYAGATGSLPLSAGARRVDGETYAKVVPKTVLSEGVFYETSGGLVVTVVAEQVLVPTSKTPASAVTSEQ